MTAIATYVGFTGTPVDATLDVFGPSVDSYTMTESVWWDYRTHPCEGRRYCITDSRQPEEVEKYYKQVEDAGPMSIR